MLMPALVLETVDDIYASLMAARWGNPVEDTLARMLASWSLGQGAMPAWLGLSETGFQSMMAHHFPAYSIGDLGRQGEPVDPQRLDEIEDLHKLLTENRTRQTQTGGWMVDMVIAGCMGNDHLWQDLGLWNRNDLSKLMQDNFAPLAMRNDKDMKWKKFLYKQLCDAEGIYVCRAPSCEVCADYADCFGSEK